MLLGRVPIALECERLRGRVRADTGVVVPGLVLPSHAGRSRPDIDPFAAADLATVECPSSELFGRLEAGVAFVRRLAAVAGRRCVW